MAQALICEEHKKTYVPGKMTPGTCKHCGDATLYEACVLCTPCSIALGKCCYCEVPVCVPAVTPEVA